MVVGDAWWWGMRGGGGCVVGGMCGGGGYVVVGGVCGGGCGWWGMRGYVVVGDAWLWLRNATRGRQDLDNSVVCLNELITVGSQINVAFHENIGNIKAFKRPHYI